MLKVKIFVIVVLSIMTLMGSIEKGSSSSANLNLTFTSEDYKLLEINYNGKEFTKIIAPGIESLQPGAPDLPTQAVWIAIPAGKQAVLRATSMDTETVQISNLAPVPQPAPETKGAPEPQYLIDDTIYERGEIFPAELAALEKESDYRGQSCAIVRFYPYQYNPVSGELLIHHRIELEISFTGSETGIMGNMYNSRMEDFISNNMINGAEIFADTEIIENRDWRNEGCDLLVICPGIFIDQANELADWKARKGIATEVVSTAVAGETCYGIGNFINQYCETSDICPQSIMLFGDAEFIPPWYVHEFPGEGMVGTDIYYADLEIEFDYLLDFSFGRLPVDTVEDAQRAVDRIIAYEQSPPTDPQYYQTALIAGAFQDGASEPPDTYANRRFAKTSEDIRNFLDQEGYDPQRVYTEYNGYNNSEIFPTYWNQNTYIFENDTPGGELPEELQKPQFPWNGTDNDVQTILNNGCFLLTHRDHGGRTGWGEPNYNSNDVMQLVNGAELPIIWSINCLTGYFDNETDDNSGTGITDECFVEQWFRNPDGGAVGAVGSTRISYSGNNDRFVWGMMDAIWPTFLEWCGADYPANNAVYQMGDVVNYGKTYLSLNCTFEDYLFISFEEFEWFGDPTMEIWVQQPQQIIATHDASLEYGEDEFIVNAGMPGAVCTLWDGTQVITEAFSGLDNLANLTLSGYDYVDELILTVSASQYLPYTADIELLSPQSGFLELTSLIIDDAAGNGNGMADYNETISLGMNLNNIGNEALSNFDLVLSCESEYITLINDNYEFEGTIEPQQNQQIMAAFQISITDYCPDGEIVTLQFSTDNNSFSEELVLHAPQLQSDYFRIDDTAGNDNNVADPGEELILSLNIQNTGSSAIENVSVLLLSYNPSLIISPAEIMIDNLFEDQIVQFTGTVLETAPIGTEYQLQVFVYSGEFNYDLIMSGVFGYAVEDFESADFSLFNWQMSGDVNWVIDTEAASGNYSARTDLMGVNSYARLSISGFMSEDGVIGFYRKLYANIEIPNNNGGVLTFYIDDEEIDSWGGNSDWQFVQFEVDAGPHEFIWEFEKDNDPTDGTDGAWLDRIEFPSMIDPPPPELTLDQQEIVLEIPADTVQENYFNITNTGAGQLEYLIFFEIAERELTGSHLSLSSYSYTPGQSLGWLLSLENNGTEMEGITDLYLSFPEQIHVNIATPLNGGSGGGLVPDGGTGSGITLNWHGETEEGNGVLLPGETGVGAVNITFAEDAPLSLILNAQIIGDQGSEINQQIEVGNLVNDWITLDHNQGVLGYQEIAQIGLMIDTADMTEGDYTKNLRIIDNMGTETILPILLTVTASDEQPDNIITVTALQNIYPNPFNPVTTISFSLKEEEQINISVYNIKGQKVAVLLDEMRQPGKHSIQWDADEYSSGVYFLQMKTANYQKISKLLLLK
ncbi:MAG: C25 family cysteine peptidase [Candidatus Stygibacter australis]|nr:C25 family cysteine peptidase [Candidatus Stygibacter australis]